jgi:hypothetical protein
MHQHILTPVCTLAYNFINTGTGDHFSENKYFQCWDQNNKIWDNYKLTFTMN